MAHGVPQGSILGPTLFLLYINDIGDHLQNDEVNLFADDTTLIFSANTIKDLIEKTNNNLGKMNNWFCANKLTVHPEKTNFMCFLEKNPLALDSKILWNNQPLQRIGKGKREETKIICRAPNR